MLAKGASCVQVYLLSHRIHLVTNYGYNKLLNFKLYTEKVSEYIEGSHILSHKN